MEKPLQRVLAVLDLLQSHARLTGAQIAHMVGVERRTVRRYIVELERFGVPIRAERGRDGHYALMPGYKLPPMMFSNDEALAISVGLRVAGELGLRDITVAGASAQAKLDRVMPAPLRKKMGDLQQVVAVDLIRPQAQSGSALFAQMTQCASAGQSLELTYCALDGHTTERVVDPYGIGYLHGAWYLAGYCHLRQEMRSFRLDRVQAARALPQSFGRPVPFDVLHYLRQSIARLQRAHTVVLRLRADAAAVRRFIPASVGTLTADGQWTRVDAQIDDLPAFARDLAGLPLAFEIVQPQALTAALLAHVQGVLAAHAPRAEQATRRPRAR
jgi:predicted DNA-binding transcriptional regulator YafY